MELENELFKKMCFYFLTRALDSLSQPIQSFLAFLYLSQMKCIKGTTLRFQWAFFHSWISWVKTDLQERFFEADIISIFCLIMWSFTVQFVKYEKHVLTETEIHWIYSGLSSSTPWLWLELLMLNVLVQILIANHHLLVVSISAKGGGRSNTIPSEFKVLASSWKEFKSEAGSLGK